MTHYIENYSYPYKQKSSLKVFKADEKLTGLSRLSHFLVGTETIENVIDRATGLILELLQVDYCRIFMLMPDGSFQLPIIEDENSGMVKKVFQQAFAEMETQASSTNKPSLDEKSLRALGLSNNDCYKIVPLRVEKTPVGILLLAKYISDESEAFPKENDFLIDLIADQLVIALHRKQLNEQLANSSIEIVLALSKTLETRDPTIGTHSRKLASWSERIAHQFGLSVRETRELCWAALLHDIGKIGIEDQILHKPGLLNPREWEVMRSHSEIGAHIVKGISGFENIASIILAHHERVDGTGYPRQLKGDEIPFGARIIAVVDSYSAMTEGRVYRSARAHEEAIGELRKFSGKMYDPDIVEVFIKLLEEQ